MLLIPLSVNSSGLVYVWDLTDFIKEYLIDFNEPAVVATMQTRRAHMKPLIQLRELPGLQNGRRDSISLQCYHADSVRKAKTSAFPSVSKI